MHVTVRVHPRAARERAVLGPDGVLEVWVRAPAVDGRANAAVLSLLAARLGVRPGTVTLVRGDRGRLKVVALPADEALLRQAFGSEG